MKLSEHNNLFKYLFIGFAVIIAIGSLVVSNYFIEDLSKEERKKIELWAEAMQIAASAEDENVNSNTNIILQILSGNNTVPVLLCDTGNNVLFFININIPQKADTVSFLAQKVDIFKSKRPPIIIKNDAFKQFVYYDDSYTLKRLQVYPYIQLGVLGIFILTSFLALLSTKKAEQNKVWVGLSKETAHQLGTPISSLMAWTEYLKAKEMEPSVVQEIEKDVKRLEIVAERFSKIGSMPSPDSMELREVVTNSVNYLQNRISKKVNFLFDFPENHVFVRLNNSLFGWVIENITKNAVDAMEGKGTIKYTITQSTSAVYLDISDTGKGIPKSKFKTVFSPGYTTKARGWGLGLSLTKRIIEAYHDGEIYVKSSVIGSGTTFRIELKKDENSGFSSALNN